LFAIASFLAVQVIWQLSLQAGWTTQTYGCCALGNGFRFWSSNQCQFHTCGGADGGKKITKTGGNCLSMLMVELLLSNYQRRWPITGYNAALQASINRLFLIVPPIVCGLAFFGNRWR